MQNNEILISKLQKALDRAMDPAQPALISGAVFAGAAIIFGIAAVSTQVLGHGVLIGFLILAFVFIVIFGLAMARLFSVWTKKRNWFRDWQLEVFKSTTIDGESKDRLEEALRLIYELEDYGEGHTFSQSIREIIRNQKESDRVFFEPRNRQFLEIIGRPLPSNSTTISHVQQTNAPVSQNKTHTIVIGNLEKIGTLILAGWFGEWPWLVSALRSVFDWINTGTFSAVPRASAIFWVPPYGITWRVAFYRGGWPDPSLVLTNLISIGIILIIVELFLKRMNIFSRVWDHGRSGPK